jgi:polyhydroxyalkanoate synthesis regulator phasin
METATQAANEHEQGLASYVREAWSQALVAVNDAGDEVQKIVHRMTGWVELGPEEARRLSVELAEKLRRERAELEATVEAAVAKAAGPFRLPSRDDVAALDARLKSLEGRVDALLASRRRRA